VSERTPLGVARVTLAYIFVFAIFWFSRPTLQLIAVGAVFVAAGESCRFWAAGHLLKSKELAVSGPYRYTQNPLYLGRFLILTGFCIMAYFPLSASGRSFPANLILLFLAYAVFFLYYLPRKIRVEGSRLREIHGAAWEQYFRSVPILFPRLTPYGANVRGWTSERMRRNREHWMLVGVVVVTLLFALKSFQGR